MLNSLQLNRINTAQDKGAGQLGDGGWDCRDWKIVVTGHSLGAGAAALVALYIHNYFSRWLPASTVFCFRSDACGTGLFSFLASRVN